MNNDKTKNGGKNIKSNYYGSRAPFSRSSFWQRLSFKAFITSYVIRGHGLFALLLVIT